MLAQVVGRVGAWNGHVFGVASTTLNPRARESLGCRTGVGLDAQAARPGDLASVEVTLQISLDGELPVGYAVDARGATREFAGWLGLVTAVEDLLTGRPARTGNGEGDAPA